MCIYIWVGWIDIYYFFVFVWEMGGGVFFIFIFVVIIIWRCLEVEKVVQLRGN